MPRMRQKRQLLVGDLPHDGVDACDRPLLVALEIKVGQEIPGAARHASVRQVLFEAMVRLAGLQDAVIDPFQLVHLSRGIRFASCRPMCSSMDRPWISAICWLTRSTMRSGV